MCVTNQFWCSHCVAQLEREGYFDAMRQELANAEKDNDNESR